MYIPKQVIEDVCGWEPTCASRYVTDWMVDERWFRGALAQIRAGTIAMSSGVTAGPATLYVIDVGGIAHIALHGAMMKNDSKFGGTNNTVRTRRALRAAITDVKVHGVMLHIDSPGGTVAGTSDLGKDVGLAAKTMPVFAHVEDLGASAAYWVASQATFIAAGETAEVGSIGTVAVVLDQSGQAEAEGIVVHVVSTGEHKGDFVPGTEVTEAQLALLQERVDTLNGFFLRAVGQGRSLSAKAVAALADGRLFPAAVAKDRGLIDRVQTADETQSQLERAIRKPLKSSAARAIRIESA